MAPAAVSRSDRANAATSIFPKISKNKKEDAQNQLKSSAGNKRSTSKHVSVSGRGVRFSVEKAAHWES